jgi:hypothetical protein
LLALAEAHHFVHVSRIRVNHYNSKQLKRTKVKNVECPMSAFRKELRMGRIIKVKKIIDGRIEPQIRLLEYELM